MKKIVLSVLVLCIAVLIFSCGKSDTGCQPVPVASEKAQLQAYCSANGITPTEHSSGLFYEIITAGSGTTPKDTSIVSVVYTGKYLSGGVFDGSANPITFRLNGVIDGWKLGIPLISKGGRIKLIIPSALAYSCTGKGSIPPNTPLFFDLTLSDVK